MEKSTHRRAENYRSAKNNYTRNTVPQEKSDIRETVLMQCIVSGIILICVLIVCYIKSDFTNGLRASLKTAIQSENDVEDLKNTGSQISGIYNSLQNKVDSLFDRDKDDSVPDDETTPVSVEDPSPTYANETDFRIDEDILNEIYQRENREDNSEKKPLAPEVITLQD